MIQNYFHYLLFNLVRPTLFLAIKFKTNEGFGGLLSLILMPATTLVIAIFITNKINYETQIKDAQMSNLFRIDDSSEWRKQVFKIASTFKVEEQTVCELRACIGPLKESSDIDNIKCDTEIETAIRIEVEYFKRYIVLYCDDILRNEGIILPEVIRIMARFLLKDHWEFYVNELHLPSKNLNRYRDNMTKSIQQTKSELLKVGFKINDEKRMCSYDNQIIE